MHFGHLVVKMLGKSGKARVKVVETWRKKCSMPGMEKPNGEAIQMHVHLKRSYHTSKCCSSSWNKKHKQRHNNE